MKSKGTPHVHAAYRMHMCWNEHVLTYPILGYKSEMHGNCCVSGGLGALTQKILKIYSSNGAFWDIPEQNLRAIVARSEALLGQSMHKLGHFPLTGGGA